MNKRNPPAYSAYSVYVLCLALILAAGCAESPLQGNETAGNKTGVEPPANATVVVPVNNTQIAYKSYTASALAFYNFTDPREKAFGLEIPVGWVVTNGSGLIRPYIDAGMAFEAKSPAGQGFFFQDPYGYVYVTPNQVLEYAGFTEGSKYDPSGGVSNPMIVMHYIEASDFARALLNTTGIVASNINVVERPDLLQSGSPLITKQTAAELSFEYAESGRRMKAVILARTSLIEMSGTGVWSASVMDYYAPENLFNETELLVLRMQKSFKIDGAWAAREQVEVNRRLGIIAQSQNEISEIISSTFEMRSKTMDELNQKWDNYILGVEDVYDPATGEHLVVDSGSKYYWTDGQGNIYGTDVAESPRPRENLHLLTCPGC